jgi:F-type H+-transporting ATPase subunit delta
MIITKHAKREAKDLLRACQVNGLLDEPRVRLVVKRLLEAKPRGYSAILEHFQRLLRLDLARRAARIESAIPLPEDVRNRIQAGLERLYGPGLRLSFLPNPALIGGLRIKVGSDVYDGSVKARLAALEESFG